MPATIRPEAADVDASVPLVGSPGRNTRRLVALIVVAVLAVPFMFAADRVAVIVDGEPRSVSTYAQTVGQALDAAGIEVGPADVVTPAPTAEVRDGIRIEVVRAQPVALHQELGAGVAEAAVADQPMITELPMAQLLDDKTTGGESSGREAAGAAPDAAPEADGELMVVRVLADGGATSVHTSGGTVADALALADVVTDEYDVVEPPLDTVLAEGVEIVVKRHEQREVVEEVRLYYHEQVTPTDELYAGESRILREGSEGVRHDTYLVTSLDGEDIQWELLREEIAVEPVDRLVEVGTRERPAEDPAPEPADEPAPGGAGDPSLDSTWDQLAQCESGGRWDYSSGPYHGGLQFHPDTWTSWRLAEHPTYAYQATREQQITVGRRLQAARGWSPWPSCARSLGYM